MASKRLSWTRDPSLIHRLTYRRDNHASILRSMPSHLAAAQAARWRRLSSPASAPSAEPFAPVADTVRDVTGRWSPRADEELMSAIAEGDRSAFDELYLRHAAWLHLRLSRRCGDPGLVEEALQDTFLVVWRKAGSYRGRGEVGAWVWGIGIHQLLNRTRRRKTPAWHLLVRSDGLVSAEDTVMVGTEHGDLAGALDGLAPELRAVVQATVVDGLTCREASRVLGVPAGTVKTRMMRARQQLREALT